MKKTTLESIKLTNQALELLDFTGGDPPNYSDVKAFVQTRGLNLTVIECVNLVNLANQLLEQP